MTSFIANKTFSFLTHVPDTIVTVLAATSTFMNSSIVPSLLSDDGVWNDLCSSKPRVPGKEWTKTCEELLLQLFSTFSDTMQFTQKIRISNHVNQKAYHSVVKHLIEKKRYFAKTVQHVCINCAETLGLCCDNLRNVRSIKLHPNWTVTEEHVQLLCRHFTLLERLDLSYLYGVSYNGLKQHIGQLKSLRYLDLSGAVMVSLSFLKDLPRLNEINLQNFSRVVSSPPPSGDTMFFSDNNNNNNNNEDDKGVFILPELTKINLWHTMLTPTEFDQLATIAPNLMELNHGMFAESSSFLTICTKMRSLRKLEIIESAVTAEGFKALAENLTELETLILDCLDIIDDECAVHISKRTSIRTLSIGVNRKFTNNGLRSLTSLKNLERLDICGVDAQFSGDIGEDYCFPESLTDLSLTDCGNIDLGLKSIIKPLPLKKLGLHFCNRLTSDGLKRALENSPSSKTLISLILAGCPQVQDLSFLRGFGSSFLQVEVDEVVKTNDDLIRQPTAPER